jgi:hypothetical protein
VCLLTRLLMRKGRCRVGDSYFSLRERFQTKPVVVDFSFPAFYTIMHPFIEYDNTVLKSFVAVLISNNEREREEKKERMRNIKLCAAHHGDRCEKPRHFKLLKSNKE